MLIRGMNLARGFRHDHRGVSAIEFALFAPVMIVLLLAGVDTTRYALSSRRIATVASNIAEMVAVNTSGSVSPDELAFYASSGFAVFPDALSDAARRKVAWDAGLKITVSSVTFATVLGVPVASVGWSAGASRRQCGPLKIGEDADAPSAATLPRDAVGTGSLVVVDISYTFTPTIASSYLPMLPIARSFYAKPRYVPAITLNGTGLLPFIQC